MAVSDHNDRRCPLAAKVDFLRRPESYTPRPSRVETVETHMAWVFLTDRYAWKMKKPVRYEFLDFSTLPARRGDCEEEVRLNRRLAHNVYFGVVPLNVDPQGTLQLDGEGEPVEWLVKMRRLPSERMLDRLIERGAVNEADVRKAAALLSGFYEHAAPAQLGTTEYRDRLAREIRANRDELLLPKYGLPADQVESLTAAQLELLDHEPALFDQRVEAERVVEAHGDLRPEHICLEEEPVIIDCLEFNRDLRLLDTVSELSFLSLECDRLSAPFVGEWVFDTYRSSTRDDPPPPLLDFYRRYHAATRAKIAVWHLQDSDIREPRKWTAKARRYLELASTSPSA